MIEEKLASFYLGKEYDVQENKLLPDAVMYDARDLTTHAVCLGMTGSGKAALDGIPSIILDPKGDVSNLLLTFPQLRPVDFEPWVNIDDARRKGLTVGEYAEQIAEKWAAGLADWDQSPQRIQRLRDAAEFLIFTPGSDSGLPVNVLQTLQAPALSWQEEEEALREKVQATVSALLGLVGIAADPVKSREHILLSNLFEHAWRAGQDLDVAKLILQIQDPPVRKLGVFDVDTFFPAKERFELSVALNNIIASPSFENWLEGQPLDVDQLLHSGDGKPRVSIFSLAHLSDAERMFFVTLLLAQVEAWMRKQTGTTSLRCILYFDEIFGYFPPHPANPPSKLPLLRLLKQARTFGVGLMLTTQNPVDLDYKGLTNAGTWFIGKLQTDRDKMRVLEGLEGVNSQAAADRAHFDRLISSLASRVFILHNVHEDRPVTFMTRWAMSYLRGPLTKRQIRTLMDPVKEGLPAAERPQAEIAQQALSPKAEGGFSAVPTRLGADIPQYFLLVDTPLERAVRQEEQRRGALLNSKSAQKVYQPAVLAWATVHFHDARRKVDHSEERTYLLPAPDDLAWVDWRTSALTLDQDDLVDTPPGDALYADVPASLGDAKNWRALEKDFQNFLYREARLSLYYNKPLRLYSEVGESQGRFVQRCQEQAAASRQAQEEKINAKFERDLERLQDRLQREERELDADRIEYEGRKREETLSLGESVLGLFTGRSRSRALSQASRKRRLTSQSRADVEESEEVIEQLEQQIKELRQEWRKALDELTQEAKEMSREIEEVQIKPRKSDIDLTIFGVAWVPSWHVSLEDASGAVQTTMLAAYRGGHE
jgi:hypothetical protein